MKNVSLKGQIIVSLWCLYINFDYFLKRYLSSDDGEGSEWMFEYWKKKK